MEKTLQTALEFIRQNGLTGYEVVNENKLNSYVFRYNTEQSADENLSRLRSVMAITPGSWFTLIGWTTGEKNRVQYKYEFANEAPQSTEHPIQIATVSGVSREELEEQIKLAEARVEQRYKMIDIERREKELHEREREFRKEKESAIGIAISQLGKFFRAAQPAIAGTEDSPMRQVAAPVSQPQEDIFEPIDDDTDKEDVQTAELETLLTEWAEADPDWYDLLKKIVAMAKNNDPKYNMAKDYL